MFRWLLCLLCLMPAWTASAPQLPAAMNAQGIAHWDQVLKEHPESIEALLQRGETYLALGFSHDALNDLEQAWHLARAGQDDALQATAAATLGKAYYQSQYIEDAKELLSQSLQWAENHGNSRLIAINANHLGNLLTGIHQTEPAKAMYLKALSAATSLDDPAQIVSIHLNLARLLKDTPALAAPHIAQANTLLHPLEASTGNTALRLSLGYQALQGGDLPLAYSMLQQVESTARVLRNPRLQSQAQGYLAQAYEQQQRHREALTLTEAAIATLGGQPEEDLLIQWQWQRGRLLHTLGHHQTALDAYRHAARHIQSIRSDIPVQYQDGRSSFRETLSPVYLGLADLLLQESATARDPEQEQALLREAQETIELLKTAEMQDYFLDACAVNQAPLSGLKAYTQHTAFLYPIILPDRLELLVDVNQRKHRVTVPVSLAQLSRTSEQLVRSLRPANSGRVRAFAMRQAIQMHYWLITPILPLLKEHQIHTLIFVPDGPLRAFPIATLNDGKQFLVERFALATVPGLTLLDPKPIPRTHLTALLAGVSVPGASVTELPEIMQDTLVAEEVQEPATPTREIKTRGLPTRRLPVTRQEPLQMRSGMRAARAARLAEALALPGVEKELNDLSGILNAQILLNDQFQLSSFEKQMKNQYRIVHIASHGLFTGKPEESFIVAHDHLLNMNKLEALFKSEAFSQSPVEILTLSACQTAEGDDRSPLGLSGVAIKSGARSALGSLWPVADEAAQQLLPEFYRGLNNPDHTKAQALQQAQIQLMHQPGYEHPSLWSPFILIGNWL